MMMVLGVVGMSVGEMVVSVDRVVVVALLSVDFWMRSLSVRVRYDSRVPLDPGGLCPYPLGRSSLDWAQSSWEGVAGEDRGSP